MAAVSGPRTPDGTAEGLLFGRVVNIGEVAQSVPAQNQRKEERDRVGKLEGS